jgi:hypothetical protein
MSEGQELILTPDEVQKRKRRVINTSDIDDSKDITVPSNTSDSEDKSQKYYNRGGRVAIQYETMGRFDIPEVMYFRDYTIEEVNNLTLSKGEGLLENLVAILDSAKNEDAGCSVGDMLLEEFMETLIGVKKQFNTTQHVHPWVCDCQEGVDEKDIKVNEEIIDLNTIQYISIEEADKVMQDIYSERLKVITDESFKNYLFKKYAHAPLENIDEYTREMEVQNLRVKEPISFVNEDGVTYSFRFIRIKDIIKAQKMADSKFNSQIKAIQNRREAGNSLAEIKERKEQELKELKEFKNKYTMLCVRGLTLLAIDGRTINVDSEKVEIYKNLSRNFLMQTMSFFDEIKIGVQDKRELVCNLCGRSNERYLQRQFQFLELLPLDTDTKRVHRQSSGLDVYFGV